MHGDLSCYCVYKTYQILHVSFQQLGSVKRRRNEFKEQLEETQHKVCVANCYCSKSFEVDFNYCRGRNLKKIIKSEYCCNQQSSFILVFVASQWNKQALCNIYISWYLQHLWSSGWEKVNDFFTVIYTHPIMWSIYLLAISSSRPTCNGKVFIIS